ncbi:hypothetical protein N8546_01840 [bacterium]|nr:hypothetical protein [bacterium]
MRRDVAAKQMFMRPWLWLPFYHRVLECDVDLATDDLTDGLAHPLEFGLDQLAYLGKNGITGVGQFAAEFPRKVHTRNQGVVLGHQIDA